MTYLLILASLLVIAAPVVWLLRSRPPAPPINTTGVCHCTRCGEHFRTPTDLVDHRTWAYFPTVRGRLRSVRCMTRSELEANFTSALFGKLGKLIWRSRA